jgi:NAD(P)-dependent dehydrogenase (short-subunit alcohol dehydrogenase family)
MRTHLIVGGSSGIGLAMVHQLSARGDRVMATYRKQSGPEMEGVTWHNHDVLDPEIQPLAIPEKLDGLVYCPGNIQLKPFARFTADDFIHDYRVQVVGAVSLLQQAMPSLRRGEKPAVVLFSTVAVGTGFPYHSMVASSKGAIEGLTRSLAAEWAPSIRVNAIAPALTDTPLASSFLNTPEKREASAQRHPLKRVGLPEDIASMACFLLGVESSWITGQVMHVDGGMGALKT